MGNAGVPALVLAGRRSVNQGNTGATWKLETPFALRYHPNIPGIGVFLGSVGAVARDHCT